MKSKKYILELELKNLYALEKQCNESLTDLSKSLNHKKMEKFLSKMNEHDKDTLITIKKILEKNSINPGSTIDSVAAEILKNIKDIIANDELSAEGKLFGLYPSFCRLLHYKISCYTAVRHISKAAGDSKTENMLKSALKDLENSNKRLKKYGKKYFLK